ncbi:MAG: hypothetical protein GXO27_01930 [Chlorobi bacterium]|nr:hypothetical protein [Chlorobiota bacterium]
MKKHTLTSLWYVLSMAALAGMAVYGFAYGYMILGLASVAALLTLWALFAVRRQSLYAFYLDAMAWAMGGIAAYGLISHNWLLVLAAVPSIFLISMLKAKSDRLFS